VNADRLIQAQMKGDKMTSTSSAIYARLALVAFVCCLACSPSSAITINSAVAVGPQLTITGTGFSGKPLSVTFNGSELTVNSSTAKQIVATIDPLPPAGTYRVVVKAGAASDTVYVTLSNIVAKISLLNQAAAIPLTNLWTPALEGVYRVSIYMVQVPPFPSGGTLDTGNVALEFQWTDDSGTQSEFSGIQTSDASLTLYEFGCDGSPPGPCPEMQVPLGGVESPASPGAVFILQVQGGTPIQYTTVYQSPPDGLAYYDLFMTVEQI
jgi:hypothetical protein